MLAAQARGAVGRDNYPRLAPDENTSDVELVWELQSDPAARNGTLGAGTLAGTLKYGLHPGSQSGQRHGLRERVAVIKRDFMRVVLRDAKWLVHLPHGV